MAFYLKKCPQQSSYLSVSGEKWPENTLILKDILYTITEVVPSFKRQRILLQMAL